MVKTPEALLETAVPIAGIDLTVLIHRPSHSGRRHTVKLALISPVTGGQTPFPKLTVLPFTLINIALGRGITPIPMIQAVHPKSLILSTIRPLHLTFSLSTPLNETTFINLTIRKSQHSPSMHPSGEPLPLIGTAVLKSLLDLPDDIVVHIPPDAEPHRCCQKEGLDDNDYILFI